MGLTISRGNVAVSPGLFSRISYSLIFLESGRCAGDQNRSQVAASKLGFLAWEYIMERYKISVLARLPLSSLTLPDPYRVPRSCPHSRESRGTQSTSSLAHGYANFCVGVSSSNGPEQLIGVCVDLLLQGIVLTQVRRQSSNNPRMFIHSTDRQLLWLVQGRQAGPPHDRGDPRPPDDSEVRRGIVRYYCSACLRGSPFPAQSSGFN